MGVALLDGEETGRYDAVMSGLCFSELSDDEIAYTLAQIRRVLRPGGLLLLADEVKPRSLPTRVLHGLVRAPLAVLTYLITQQTTHPVAHLSERLTEAGLSIVSVRSSPLAGFSELVARKPVREAP